MTDQENIYINYISYIANSFSNSKIDFHKLFKILYFAEQKHLVKYGSNLIEDEFIAMPKGPVPSSLYDFLKDIKSNNPLVSEEVKKCFNIVKWEITSLCETDMDWLSDSEIACLNESINENKNLTFGQLSDKSHDEAWHAASRYMRIDLIAKAGGANEEMMSYIKDSFIQTAY